jgi:hypothetical protein
MLNVQTFSAEPLALRASGMLGPAYPFVVGNDTVTPIRNGGAIQYPSQWACGDSANNTLVLDDPDASGRYRTMWRQLGALRQDMTFSTGPNGAFSGFTLEERRAGVLEHTTTMTVTDLNSDGVADAFAFVGQYNATIGLVQNGDYVSIPWSEASTLGIDTASPCAGVPPLPQIWIPLADTNGDGRGDAIVMDLNADGVADGDLLASPMISAPSVPTMGPGARLLLIMLIGAIGAWFLSRHRNSSVGTPA